MLVVDSPPYWGDYCLKMILKEVIKRWRNPMKKCGQCHLFS